MRTVIFVTWAMLTASLSGLSDAKANGFEAYFVFVGATKGTYEQGMRDGQRLSSAAKRCGFDVWSDASWKFRRGSGMTFWVLTEYFPPEIYGETRASTNARAVASRVKKCIPDAYAKKLVHLGD